MRRCRYSNYRPRWPPWSAVRTATRSIRSYATWAATTSKVACARTRTWRDATTLIWWNRARLSKPPPAIELDRTNMFFRGHPKYRVLVALLALGVLAPVVRAGETLDRVRHSGILQDVLVDDYPPFGFINNQNQLAGFDVDVAQAIAHKLGVQLRMATPGWETIAAGRWHGRWDICVCSMSPTPERGRGLDFPARSYTSPAVLVINKDERHIRSIADISGRRVGVGTGSSYESYLHRALQIPGGAAVQYPFHDVVVIPGDETVNFRNLSLGPGVRLDAI